MTTKEYSREWRKRNPTKVKLYNQRRSREYNSEQCKRYYLNNKSKILLRLKEYVKIRRRTNPEVRMKERIRAITKNNYNRTKCNNCNVENNLQFHHFIYRLPLEEKDFVVLCNKCHGEMHNYL